MKTTKNCQFFVKNKIIKQKKCHIILMNCKLCMLLILLFLFQKHEEKKNIQNLKIENNKTRILQKLLINTKEKK